MSKAMAIAIIVQWCKHLLNNSSLNKLREAFSTTAVASSTVKIKLVLWTVLICSHRFLYLIEIKTPRGEQLKMVDHWKTSSNCKARQFNSNKSKEVKVKHRQTPRSSSKSYMKKTKKKCYKFMNKIAWY